MTPTPNTPAPAGAWWQTLVVTSVNIALAALANHYLGPVAAGVTVASGTAVAHNLPSPRQQR